MKKSEKTKQKIVESTIDLVAEKGYAATSTREIAANAGVSEATIFKYYKSKDKLLMTIVEQTIDEFYDYSFHQALPQILEKNKDKPISNLIKEVLLERLSFFSANSKGLQVIVQEMMVNESVRKYFKDKVWKKLDQISKEFFNQGKNEGVFKDIDTYFMQKAFFGMLFYTNVFENVLDIDSNDYNNLEQAEMVMEILFNGIKK